MLSVPFVPLSICPRSNIYVSSLNSEPCFLSCFLLCCSLTTFTRLHCAAACLSVPPRRLCYLTFPVSVLLRQPFLASFMFSLINYSIGDAETKSGTDCQQIIDAVKFSLCYSLCMCVSCDCCVFMSFLPKQHRCLSPSESLFKDFDEKS